MAPHRGTTRKQPQHRVYQPGKRHMELIASVSRSSGLEKDGDALRDPKIQEEYRTFIQGKLDQYWKKCLSPSDHGIGKQSEDLLKLRKEEQGNILILFRKLREGLLSTQRRDEFALEVYETSLHLSVLFKSPVQTTSTLSHLFPDFYVRQASPTSSSSRTITATSIPPPDPSPERDPSYLDPTTPPDSALPSTLIFLLHHLVASYPSQISFHTQLRQLHPSLQDVLRTRASVQVLPLSQSSSLAASVQQSCPSCQPLAASSPLPCSCASFSSSSTSPPSSRHHLHHAQAARAARASAETRTPLSAHEWLLALARCLRTRNYARLEGLTRLEVFGRFIEPIQAIGPIDKDKDKDKDKDESKDRDAAKDGREARNLVLGALGVLVEALLVKARASTWDVLRTAYREVSLRATPVPSAPDAAAAAAAPGDTTGDWMARSLVLRTNLTSAYGVRSGSWHPDESVGGENVQNVEAWLDERRGKGEARRKEGEGMEGRWILVKA